MERKRVTSFVKPDYIDSSSSPTTVYINKNIVESIETRLIEGEFKDFPTYSYDQYKYTRAEFELVEQFLENDEKLNRVTKEYDKRITELENTVARQSEIIIDLNNKINNK